MKSPYAVPSVVSYSESEILDLLGPARTYPSPEALPTGDPSSGGGATSGGSSDPKKGRK